MKKTLLFGIIGVSLLASSCDSNKAKEAQQALADQEALNQATKEELQAALSERDELIDLVSGITSSLDSIRYVEKIISVNGASGELSTKASVSSDLNSIKSALAERRNKLAALEAKLKDSKISNSKLLSTIENLKKQIDDQTSQIETLTANLNLANERIGVLDNQVDSLSNTVRTVTGERDEAQAQAVEEANKANECFYAVGSKKELKDHNIIESGFLRKTKVLPGDFDKSFFNQADKRTLTTIPLHSKKAKVVSNAQPAGSYEIVDVNGQKVLRILSPSQFWGTSNYVVIQID